MNQFFSSLSRKSICGAALAVSSLMPGVAFASSHQDAPLITQDPPANTTDVYAFVSQRNAQKYLTVAVGVYPFEEPGVGPNIWRFDDQVRYQIHISTGADLTAGEVTYTYSFNFVTNFKNRGTMLPSFLGVVNNVGDA